MYSLAIVRIVTGDGLEGVVPGRDLEEDADAPNRRGCDDCRRHGGPLRVWHPFSHHQQGLEAERAQRPAARSRLRHARLLRPRRVDRRHSARRLCRVLRVRVPVRLRRPAVLLRLHRLRRTVLEKVTDTLYLTDINYNGLPVKRFRLRRVKRSHAVIPPIYTVLLRYVYFFILVVFSSTNHSSVM